MPDLDDLGIDPWGDLGIIQDTPEPAPDLIQDEVIQDPDQADLAGEGGPAFFSLIPDDRSYLTSYSGSSFVYYTATLPTGYNVVFNNYTLPSQIGSGDENMFGSTYLFRYTGKSSGFTQHNFYFRDLTLSCSLDVPDGAESVAFKGTMTFYFISKAGTSSPVTVSDIPNKNCYKSCTIDILGGSYSGIYNSTSKSFNFDTGDIDLSSFTGSSLEVKINFSQSELWQYTMSGSSTYYVGIRFMFTDGVNATFTVPDPPPGGGFDEESKGLLRTIVDTIKGVLTAIVELPGRIVTGILDGLKGLFVPAEEDLQDLKDKYETLLSERLGFVWQAGEMVISFGQSVLSAFETATDFQFEFPGISFELPELGQVTLIEPQVVNVNNAFMDVMQPVLGTIVSFICVLAFINTAERMVVAVVSGVSYFHFLKGD